jgi:hypothetical protein
MDGVFSILQVETQNHVLFEVGYVAEFSKVEENRQ